MNASGRNITRGFTLTELLVTVTIVAILAALTLSGLSAAGRSQKREATKFTIRKLSDAIIDAYEDAEDAATQFPTLLAVRQHLRSTFPDSWDEVAPSAILPNATTPLERAYARYKASGGPPSNEYQGAECLYMIITQSGKFPDFVASIRPDQIGDVDGDGKKEFLDAWGNPIAFMRWPPGFVPPMIGTASILIADPVLRHDPFDRWYVPPPASPPIGSDPTAYALFPLIYSAGPDEAGNAGSSGPSGYGLLRADNGWPDNALIAICGFNPSGQGVIGSPDPANARAHVDNITNFELMLE
jgi:prepilin-type N-terminal cleavage/methylation domain-containing protein